MTRRYLALCCWLLCLFTLAGCVSPFREVDRVGEYTPEIDPQAGNRSGGTITADLWLPVKSRDYFAVKTFSVAVASGERPEMAVLKELGRHQEPGDILVAPMWSSLQVLEVTDDNQTLYVTLSKEFLSPPTADESQRAAMCRAAVLSISNTLLGMGEYSQVQILVEMPSTGKVQRPTRGQAGFLGSDENTVLGLLTAQPELILTPWTAAEIAMRAVSNMDSRVPVSYTHLGSSAGFRSSAGIGFGINGDRAKAQRACPIGLPWGWTYHNAKDQAAKKQCCPGYLMTMLVHGAILLPAEAVLRRRLPWCRYAHSRSSTPKMAPAV